MFAEPSYSLLLYCAYASSEGSYVNIRPVLSHQTLSCMQYVTKSLVCMSWYCECLFDGIDLALSARDSSSRDTSSAIKKISWNSHFAECVHVLVKKVLFS